MSRFSAHREPFSKGEKVLFLLLPVGVLGFALSGWWLARSDDLPPLNIPASAALPSPNGFDFYVAAAGAMVPANPSVDPTDDRRGPIPPPLAAKDYALARRLIWLRANRAGFALVKNGNATPSRHTATPLPSQSFRTGILSVDYAALRQLARSKVIEANTSILQKRWGEATQSSLDTIQMGCDIARGGPLIARLVGTAITAIGRDPLATSQRVPEKLSAPQAKSAARRLEAILAARPTYRDALSADKWLVLALFRESVQKGNWRSLATQNSPKITWRERLAMQFLSAREVSKRISNGYDQCIADVEKPYRIAAAAAPGLDAVSDQFVPKMERLRFNEGRELVSLHVLLLRFALRAYHQENGKFPKTLNQLAPRYLKAIPRDYFASGAPFGYRNKGQTYDLWSVGPDGRDNGGVPIIGRSGQVGTNEQGRFPSMEEGSTGDYVAGKNR